MITPPNNLIKESENLKRMLNERLEMHNNSRKAVQDKLREICKGLKQTDEFEDKINSKLEDKFNKEDSRLQDALNNLRDIDMDKLNDDELRQAIQKAKAELLVTQSYELVEREHTIQENYIDYEDDDDEDSDYEEPAKKKRKKKLKRKTETKQNQSFDLMKKWELKVNNEVVPEMLELRKPTNVIVTGANDGKTSIQFIHLNSDEKRVLSEYNITDPFKYKCLLSKKGSDVNDNQNCKEYTLIKMVDCFTFTPDFLEIESTYVIKVKAVLKDKESEWSDEIELVPKFSEYCVWKECPDGVDPNMKYSVDKSNHKIATKRINYNKRNKNVNKCCTIIGNIFLPLNKVTSWNIKILKSKDNDGDDIYIGVAPFDIDQNKKDNYNKCGWYFNCSDLAMYFDDVHKYQKAYGSRKRKGGNTHTNNSVGIIMDTTKGELSYIVNGVNYGVSRECIPLDKPLVPCVILGKGGDSVELDTSSEVKVNVDYSLFIPSDIIAKSDDTWDSITLTWDAAVEGDASFYQIEVDGSKLYVSSKTNIFTKRGFFPDSTHTFRIRTVKNNAVGKWSAAVKGKTSEKSFENSWWKECSDDVDQRMKYLVDGFNTKIATMVGDKYCTIIGNTPFPLNKITQCRVKILKSSDNDGDDIYIGVAPFDIDQNEDNCNKCGWYFNCYNSTLCSGPPHNYIGKKYGDRTEKCEYVCTRSIVEIIMDTKLCELSFAVNGWFYKNAFEGIPLDKPLLPCVILKNSGDSVELIKTSDKLNQQKYY